MKLHFFLNYYTGYGESLWMCCDDLFAAKEGAGKLVPLQYVNGNQWSLLVDDDNVKHQKNHYRYYFKGKDGALTGEAKNDRVLYINENSPADIYIFDEWNYAGDFNNAFYTAPFKNVLLAKQTLAGENKTAEVTHVFNVKAPLLNEDEAVCILGNVEPLRHWDTANPLLLEKRENFWSATVNLTDHLFAFNYKFGIYNTRNKSFISYETGSNRVCNEVAAKEKLFVYNCGFLKTPDRKWRGTGVAIPVFSLRSENSFGIGEFTDIPLLADWAKATGLKLIQLLPINDTTATKTKKDSYPYAAISAFALHPVYINLNKLAGDEYAHLLEPYKSEGAKLNQLPYVAYEEVLKAKLKAAFEVFEAGGNTIISSKSYKDFLKKNEYWLKPYAAFCYLRDHYDTVEFSNWESLQSYSAKKTENFFKPKSEAFTTVNFYCYLQYHLYLQLKEAVDYAHNNGIVLKGDIPIGIYRNSVDAWVQPDLYNMNEQAGAPPDDFAVAGQNWGFPTYNWEKMQQDGFKWWSERFEQMCEYFDAFRIDHILGFFRIWSIPIDAVQGIMGHFEPSIPVHINEFAQAGITFEKDRFCKPFINEIVLREVFAGEADYVKNTFLETDNNFSYRFSEAFNTQRKIAGYFEKFTQNAHNEWLQKELFNLISNVILFEQAGSNGTQFHFRIAMDAKVSYQSLPQYIKSPLYNLYVDYFFRRQDDFWRKEALKKLPKLKEVTDMLVCGEDLGMVPDCVPQVMRDLGILSLEIQRMPKQSNLMFFNPAYAPYLSVVTPSTHDMSTVRGWWEEDKAKTQLFFNNELHCAGEAPQFCEPWINKRIIQQHLYAPAMWSIFQIQDLLGMSRELRRENPNDERINIPADPNHYWRYRMHLTLENLLTQFAFNNELLQMVKESGR